MAEESKLRECSFFLVRYVPDLVRDEALNIGLFLYSPAERYLGCVFTDDFRRVKRFHPQADLEFLRDLQQDFEQRVDEHGDDLEAYIREMQESFSNLVQVTAPRTCLLRDPQAEIQNLFARYVGPRLSGPPAEDTRLRVKQRLTAAFVRAGVWERLEKRIPAEQWTKKGDPFSFDYGYRALRIEGKPNGHIKLVHALSLKRDTELAKVLAYTIERVREKEPADLTAVVEALAVEEDRAARAAQEILEERRIVVQPLAGVEEYAQSVRRELLM
jgi:hypothetical protein